MDVTNALLGEHPRVIVYALGDMSVPERRRLIERMDNAQRAELARNAAYAVLDRVHRTHVADEDERSEVAEQADELLMIVLDLLDDLTSSVPVTRAVST